MTLFKKIDFILIKILERLLIILLAASTVSIFIQVISRYFLKIPLLWTEELSRYLLIWLAFLGGALGIRDKSHLNVEIFLRMVKGKVEQLFYFISCIFEIMFLAALVRGSLEIIPKLGRFKSPMIHIQMHWVYAAMVVGGGLMIYEIIFSLFFEKEKYLKQKISREVE